MSVKYTILGNNTSNETETPNITRNGSIPDYYEYEYGLWPHQALIEDVSIALLVLGGILVIVDLILLLTCISREARSRSASWYLYHMIGLSVVTGVLVVPLEYTANVCQISLLLSKVISCVRGMNLILINVEIMATVLVPQALWERYRKCRFFSSVGFIWLFSIVFIGGIYNVHKGIYTNDCYVYGHVELILLHIMNNLLPGFVLICFTIAAIVKYCRWHRNGTYNQIPGNSEETVQYREWFVCLIVLNSLYIVLDVLVYFLHMLIIYHVVFEIVTLALANLVVFILPLSIVALKEIRTVLKQGVMAVWVYVCKRRDRPPLPSTENDQDINLNMDTIDDQSL